MKIEKLTVLEKSQKAQSYYNPNRSCHVCGRVVNYSTPTDHHPVCIFCEADKRNASTQNYQLEHRDYLKDTEFAGMDWSTFDGGNNEKEIRRVRGLFQQGADIIITSKFRGNGKTLAGNLLYADAKKEGKKTQIITMAELQNEFKANNGVVVVYKYVSLDLLIIDNAHRHVSDHKYYTEQLNEIVESRIHRKKPTVIIGNFDGMTKTGTGGGCYLTDILDSELVKRFNICQFAEKRK